MVEVSLAFVLANGRSAAIGPVPARLICDRLWGLGVAAGAATAAVRISDALRSSPTLRGDVVFGEREVPPLLEAAKAHPPRWGCLADRGTLEGISRDAGHAKIRLLTTELLPEAIALYKSSGYTIVSSHREENHTDYWLEKGL